MEWITFFAILLSPAIAVLVSIWLQRRKELRDRKNHIFTTLMMHRRTYPPAPDWINALNLIDIIFFDSPKVLTLWHEYFRLLGSAQSEIELKDREHKYLEMLSAMASELGYRNLQQTDIDKFYTPAVINQQTELNQQLQSETLKFFQSIGTLVANQVPTAKDSDPESPDGET